MNRPACSFTSLWRGVLSRAEPPAAPRTDPEPQALPCPFGPTLTELQCALACFDLVDKVVRAEGPEPTERERMAHLYASWSLARAAERLERAYCREAQRGEADHGT